MKKRHQIVVMTLVSIFLFILCGCQKAPIEKAVVNKNESNYKSGPVDISEGSHSESGDEQQAFTTSFSSTDGSVIFNVNIMPPVVDNNTQTVKVSSHFLTEDDAKRVATSLFPDVEFYEAEPPQSENLSKSEIQQRIHRWSQYADFSALKSLYGDTYSDAALTDMQETIKSFVENYTLRYESASAENTHQKCMWKWRKTLDYLLSEEELIGIDTSDSNDEISTQLTYDDVPYCFTASTRNKSDYKVNLLSAYIYTGMGPANLDENVIRAQLARTAEPTQSDIDTVKAKAEKMLAEMNLGTWQIDECYVDVQEYGKATEYTICVNVVPAFGSTSTLRHTQLSSLKNKDGYAPEQYYTDVNFAFSAEGDLISFNMYTPVEIKETINTEVMSISSLLERAQIFLTNTDSYAYGYGNYLPLIDESVQCIVDISSAEVGLSRIKVQNEDDSYFYVPSVLLKGISTYVGEETDRVFYASTEPESILCINAIDGTIISACGM